MKHPGIIKIQVRDYTTDRLKKVYSDVWAKLEGEDIIAKFSDYNGIHKYSDEPYNSKIKFTCISGTMILDAIWIYK